MVDDWRLVNQEKYLKGKTVIKANFMETSKCDHTHCAFCWDKFSNCTDMLHTGYRVADGSWWICEKCFNDFKKQFNWKLGKIETDSVEDRGRYSVLTDSRSEETE